MDGRILHEAKQGEQIFHVRRVEKLQPTELDQARAELASAGFSNPTIRNFDDADLDAESLDKPLDVLMDVEPRNAQTIALVGRSFNQDPVVGPTP